MRNLTIIATIIYCASYTNNANATKPSDFWDTSLAIEWPAGKKGDPKILAFSAEGGSHINVDVLNNGEILQVKEHRPDGWLVYEPPNPSPLCVEVLIHPADRKVWYKGRSMDGVVITFDSRHSALGLNGMILHVQGLSVEHLYKIDFEGAVACEGIPSPKMVRDGFSCKNLLREAEMIRGGKLQRLH